MSSPPLQAFLANTKEFVCQLDSVSYINLFLTELRSVSTSDVYLVPWPSHPSLSLVPRLLCGDMRAREQGYSQPLSIAVQTANGGIRWPGCTV